MSKRTAAELDPFIANVELEHDRVQTEGLEQALITGIQQQAASGQIPPMIVAKIMMLVQQDKMELADAMTKVVADAQKAQEEAKAAEPGAMPTPEQAAAPGAASLTGSAIPGASATQTDLSGLLSTLRRPGRGMANTVGNVNSSGQVAV